VSVASSSIFSETGASGIIVSSTLLVEALFSELVFPGTGDLSFIS
jgi:hypothetical protein